MNRSRAVAVGAFVIAGVLLFGAGLFLIGDRRMLFNRTFNVTAEFANIAGLEEGAKVRVAGLDAGAVDTIHVPANPSARFRVELRIRQDLHPLIRVDSVATIQTDGLVGNKFVQVEAGTDQGYRAAGWDDSEPRGLRTLGHASAYERYGRPRQ